MKSRNQTTNRWLGLALSFVLSVFLSACHGVRTQERPAAAETFVFEGTVVKIAPDLGTLSGRVAVYRLAKYRVQKVCSGNYDGKEIVVDHLILNGKEFDGVDVGDRVCVIVHVSDKILSRYNADGIRSPSDSVKTFYWGEKIEHIEAGRSCCDVR